ncbi:energy-coupling factor transporter transmembrane component T [Paenibacillus qinlingensis]|uniref:energy-coupling factor transporter transmembrane component T n=1 Tax=Paenibacillus qinlingensis TaxID=1837343 RepID=UPI001564C4E5|nr:energy-coupling factor transporter transmembrane component T [Paenibacillus qinlingensis]NQX60679.1 energy-coupling factor transporter transmembrane protein EcfT [Paenibacillus qinlingensis]
MKDSFSSFHPIVNFLYFTLVILFSMVFMHPICLAISITFAFSYSIYLNRSKAIKFNFLYMLPLLVMTAFINPAFNHEGVTIITYLHNGNPLTLESITYGIAAAAMFVTVICWFSCYNAIMTSDKFIYLFGRIIPAMSLIFSMVLRFVPKFKAQLTIVSHAQRCIGRDVSNGSVISRIMHGIRILSIMVTWMLENAIETADSMKSRGYGLQGRTAFSIFTWDSRDKAALIAIVLTGGYLIIGACTKALYFRYFPSMRSVELSVFSTSVFVSYAILCAIPLSINVWEDYKWKSLQSNI